MQPQFAITQAQSAGAITQAPSASALCHPSRRACTHPVATMASSTSSSGPCMKGLRAQVHDFLTVACLTILVLIDYHIKVQP